jgi:hypothetical protein
MEDRDKMNALSKLMVDIWNIGKEPEATRALERTIVFVNKKYIWYVIFPSYKIVRISAEPFGISSGIASPSTVTRHSRSVTKLLPCSRAVNAPFLSLPMLLHEDWMLRT